jgi:hypothetical protein
MLEREERAAVAGRKGRMRCSMLGGCRCVFFWKKWGAGGGGGVGEGGRGCFVEVHLRIPVCDGGGLSILAERFSLVQCLEI